MSDEARAQWYLDAGRPREALDALRGAHPESVHGIRLRAEALNGLGRLDEAEADARRGLALAPEDIPLFDVLTRIQLRRDPRAAEETIRNALQLDPERARLLALYVLVLIGQRRFEAAEAMLERALRADPSDPAVGQARSLFFIRASRSAEARDAARELLRRFPDDAFAHYLNGMALFGGPRLRRARRHLREAAALRPQDPLLTESARRAHEWWIVPFHLLAAVAGVLLPVALAGWFFFDLPGWTAAAAAGLLACLAAFAIAMNMVLLRRIARARREL